jgi:hypothetical protein
MAQSQPSNIDTDDTDRMPFLTQTPRAARGLPSSTSVSVSL